MYLLITFLILQKLFPQKTTLVIVITHHTKNLSFVSILKHILYFQNKGAEKDGMVSSVTSA